MVAGIVGLPSGCVPRGTSPELKPLASIMVKGLKQRGIDPAFMEMETFFGARLDASGGTNTFSDKTGNCRLAWVDKLLRHPLTSISEADGFTRQAYAAVSQQKIHLGAIIDLAAVKLRTVGAPMAVPSVLQEPATGVVPAVTDNAGLNILIQAVVGAGINVQKALAPLAPAEIAELHAGLYYQTTGHDWPAVSVADKAVGRRMFDLLESMDAPCQYAAARSVSVLVHPEVLRDLGKVQPRPAPAMNGVNGSVVAVFETSAGRVVVGGHGTNEYLLDTMTNVCAVVDLGGDDGYIEGSLSADRPVLVIIDLGGHDVYRGVKPGIQGGALLGVSMLVDVAGNDRYEAVDVAQGSSLGGVGVLVDMAGDDHFTGRCRVQGQAIGGIGLLIDRTGEDRYRGALLAQGVGGPLGFGLLADLTGADHYYAGGLYASPYDDSPGYAGFSQGVGIGPRGAANGGIGALLDGGGDDIYEADYFSMAGGYWFAAGFMRDFGGNDQRLGSTRTAFDGSERKPARFMRWGVGFGCHYAAGYLFDDKGDDLYLADFAGVAFAWDLAIAVICDFEGNDRYVSPGHGAATAANAGLAVLYDAAGDDVYQGAPPATVKQNTDYHPDQKTGGNFAFLIDGKGQDQYPGNLENGGEYERGWAGGFLIDR